MKRISLVILVLTLLMSSCFKDIFCVRGNGIIETQYRNIPDFSEVENSTSVNVIYKRADSVSLTITAESNLIGYIVTQTVNNKLEIKTSSGGSCLDFNQQPVIMITSPELNNIISTGSGDLTADTLSGNSAGILITGSGYVNAGAVLCENLIVKVTGSGDAGISNASCQNPDISISGSGDISVKGNANAGQFVISGSGNINSGEFTINSANETISGSGNIFTSVVNTLNAVISGSGNIYLKGDPVINQIISGSGRIIKY
jgi:hypothetical protein